MERIGRLDGAKYVQGLEPWGLYKCASKASGFQEIKERPKACRSGRRQTVGCTGVWISVLSKSASLHRHYLNFFFEASVQLI
jgi:hypothetical protein